MEADRSGGGPNPNSGGGGGGGGGSGGGGSGNSGAGRNPNGPKAAPGQSTSGAGVGPMAAGAIPGSFLPQEAQDGDSGMTLPGILHFIQYEWGRFQAEKYRWEAERDELRVILLFFFFLVFSFTPKKAHCKKKRTYQSNCSLAFAFSCSLKSV